MTTEDEWMVDMFGDSASTQEHYPEVMAESLQWRLAIQWAPIRWRAGLKDLVARMERAVPLQDAIDQIGPRLPSELLAICETSRDLPSPSQFVLEALALRAKVSATTRRLYEAAIYPVLILMATLIISFFLCAVLEQLVQDIGGAIGLDGQGTDLIRDQQFAIVALFGMLMWLLLVWLTFRWFGPAWSLLALIGGIPYLGKTIRWLSLFEMIGRIDTLERLGIKGPAAMESTAQSFWGAGQAIVARSIAFRTHSGLPLGDALAECNLSDGFCAPALLSLNSSLSASDPSPQQATLSDISQLLMRMAENRIQFLGLILTVVLFMLIASIVWGVLSSYLQICVSLLSWIDG